MASASCACLESKERAFIKTYKNPVFLMIKELEASSQPPQHDTRLYRLLRKAHLNGGRRLVPRLENALNAPPDALRNAVAKPVKVQNCESHEAATSDTNLLFVMRVRDVANYDYGKSIEDLPETHSHGRAKVVHNNAAFRTQQSIFCEKRELRGPNGQNTFGTSIRDFSILCSGLCPRCSLRLAMVATTAQKILPIDFGLSFSQTAEA